MGGTLSGHVGSRSGRQSQARGVQRGIDNSQTIVLGQECLFVGNACLYVVDASDVGNVGAQSRIGQCPILSNRFPLQAGWSEIRERIPAGLVVIVVAPDESADGENGIGIED